MTDFRKPKPHVLQHDEKLVTLMLYFPNGVYRGEVVTKESIRPNIWMRTVGAPDYMHMIKAQYISLAGPQIKPIVLPEAYIATAPMIAYHVAPPSDPGALDYDESEGNRTFEYTPTIVGPFFFNGCLRVSTSSDSGSAIISNRTAWTSMYQLEISSTALPQMGVIKVPMALVRAQHVAFGMQTS